MASLGVPLKTVSKTALSRCDNVTSWFTPFFCRLKAANLKRKMNDPRMHGLLDQSTVLEEGEGWAGLVTYKLN